MTRVLFLCSMNRLRSPTAEQVFANHPGIECDSAGLNDDAATPVTGELIEWAELIFVMEKHHRTKLTKLFRKHLRNRRVVCLDIPDNYDLMDPELVEILKRKVTPFLISQRAQR
ncbi:MAG: low molecular weight protein tyrosine phosphatase family protein [Micropepsaceae bacterium]